MLVDNCSIEMNIGFTIEDNRNHVNASAFPKVVSDFIKEDIYVYRKDTTPLDEKYFYQSMWIFSFLKIQNWSFLRRITLTESQKNTDEANLEQAPTQCSTKTV